MEIKFFCVTPLPTPNHKLSFLVSLLAQGSPEQHNVHLHLPVHLTTFRAHALQATGNDTGIFSLVEKPRQQKTLP